MHQVRDFDKNLVCGIGLTSVFPSPNLLWLLFLCYTIPMEALLKILSALFALVLQAFALFMHLIIQVLGFLTNLAQLVLAAIHL